LTLIIFLTRPAYTAVAYSTKSMSSLKKISFQKLL